MSDFKEALRIFSSRYKRKKTYPGNARSICKQVVADCWNGKFFMSGVEHFTEFYTRDFGFTVDGLLELGYSEQVHATLSYALEHFNRQKHIAVMITPSNEPLDFPTYATDSLPLLLRALRVAGAHDLVERYKEFLEHQALFYFNTVFDIKTGLVKKKHFSSMKDHAIRESSCYDNCMASLLKDELEKLGLRNPFLEFDIKQNIVTWFWNGNFFREEMGSDRVTGDSQVMPFWCGVVKSKAMFTLCVGAIQNQGLDDPFPLKYTATRTFNHITVPWIFTPNYEGNSIWMFAGMAYLEVVRRFDKELLKKYLKAIGIQIEKYGRFVEVYNPNGTPYSTPFYMADTMVWAATYLSLLQCT